MDSPKDSAKVLQTKRLLAAQMMKLLENKNFKKITINDICQNAMVSRSAFYFHFEDKYHLLNYCLEEELKQWETTIHMKSIDDFIVFTLESLLKKKKFYHNVFVAEMDKELIDIFQKKLCQFFTAFLKEKQDSGHQFCAPLSVISAFCIGGIACSTVQWMQNDFNISKEELAAYQKNLLSNLLD